MSSIMGSATEFNDMINNTLKGDPAAAAKFGNMSRAMSQLGLNPFSLLHGTSQGNFLSIANAVSKPGSTQLAAQLGGGWADLSAAETSRGLSGSKFFNSGFPYRNIVTKADQANAVDAGQFKMMIDLMAKLFGNAVLGGMVGSLKRANAAMADPKFQAAIKEIGDAVGKFVGAIVDIGTFLIKSDPGPGRASLWPGGPTFDLPKFTTKEELLKTPLAPSMHVEFHQTIVGMPTNVADKVGAATIRAINSSKLSTGSGKPLAH